MKTLTHKQKIQMEVEKLHLEALKQKRMAEEKIIGTVALTGALSFITIVFTMLILDGGFRK